MLDIQGYKHTRIICNTYCFSTATVVARTRLNINIYVHCLSSYDTIGVDVSSIYEFIACLQIWYFCNYFSKFEWCCFGHKLNTEVQNPTKQRNIPHRIINQTYNVVCTATRYKLEGTGFEPRWVGGKISWTHQASCSTGIGFYPGSKGPGVWRWPRTTF